MHYYRIYGLYVESQISLFEDDFSNARCSNLPDVHIKISNTLPYEILKKTDAGLSCEYSHNLCWFSYNENFIKVENGNTITVFSSNISEPNMHRPYILGWGMAFLFFQKGHLGFHCSALFGNTKAFLISGESGAGKSTISHALQYSGYKFMCDDIAFPDPARNNLVHPAYPIQKLCRNIAETISDQSLLCYIDEDKDKFAFTNIAQYESTPHSISHMFIIAKKNSADLTYRELQGTDKLQAILDSLFLSPIFKRNTYPASILTNCLKIASSLKVIKIERPIETDTVNKICSIIINYLL